MVAPGCNRSIETDDVIVVATQPSQIQRQIPGTDRKRVGPRQEIVLYVVETDDSESVRGPFRRASRQGGPDIPVWAFVGIR